VNKVILIQSFSTRNKKEIFLHLQIIRANAETVLLQLVSCHHVL